MDNAGFRRLFPPMRLSWKILICIFAVEALGGVGGWITSSQIPGWYGGLEQPPGTPPNWVFGPVWLLLYAMMGAAFALVWHRASPGRAKRVGMGWFGWQLALNVAWTPVFFGMHRMLAALVVIIALWFAIVITMRSFRSLDRLAAALLAPYLLWVSYAAYLNAGYLLLNRGLPE